MTAFPLHTPRPAGCVPAPAIADSEDRRRFRLVTAGLCAGARRVAALAFLATLALPIAAAPLVFVEASLAPPSPIVSAQAVYTLRFFQAIDLRELRFSVEPPRLAELREIDTLAGSVALSRTRDIDGRRYRVLERRYHVIPFASGTLALAGGVSGQTPGGQPVRVDAAPLTVEVQAAPQLPDGVAWLPARRLGVSETWPDAGFGADDARAAQGDRGNAAVRDSSRAFLRVGEVLTREVRIEAVGVDASALPAIGFAPAPGFRVHADAARFSNRLVGIDNIGIREQRFHFVPTQSGALLLPAARLDWWDVEQQRWRAAALPARRIAVKPVAPASDKRAQGQINRDAGDEHPATHRALDLRWLLPLLLLPFVVAAAFGWRRQAVFRRWQARRELFDACRRGDPFAARAALLAWTRLRYPDKLAGTLGAVVRCLPAAREEIARLERRLYGPAAAPWQGRSLAAAIRRS